MLTILLQSALILPQSAVGTLSTPIEATTPEKNISENILAEADESSPWTGSADVGLTLISGNNESSNASALFVMKWAGKLDDVALGAQYASARTTDGVTNDAYSTARLYQYDAEYNRFFSEEKNLFGFAKFSSREDQPNGLQMRNAGGAGVGYRFHLYTDTVVNIGAGSSYVSENKVNVLATTSAVATAFFNFNTPLTDSLTFEGKGDYLTGSDVESYVQDLTLRWNFNADWNLRLSHNIAWDGNPSAGFTGTDRRLELTIGTTF